MTVAQGVEQFDYDACTNRMLMQMDGSETVQMIIDAGHTIKEAYAGIVALSATTFFADLEKPQQEPEYLSYWHATVEERCSARYADLLIANPGASRARLNEDTHLQQLNGFRKGLQMARTRSYKTNAARVAYAGSVAS
jgi:hypothetical protein